MISSQSVGETVFSMLKIIQKWAAESLAFSRASSISAKTVHETLKDYKLQVISILGELEKTEDSLSVLDKERPEFESCLGLPSSPRIFLK